jgi:hypothetical protein
MSAKQKLNAAYFLGAALTAGLIGLLVGSWTVFGVALAALLVANCHAGDLRR